MDAVFGRNPLDAATLNSDSLASAATRVIRYFNAGIAGRAPSSRPRLHSLPGLPTLSSRLFQSRGPLQARMPALSHLAACPTRGLFRARPKPLPTAT
ncbi:hypothetical protein HETIRDRAFT_437391, partial [Heterobasidion irregulare TC 32-1]